MNGDVIFNIVLISIMVLILIVYSVYVILDEKKKRRYYKSKIYYETGWDMYSTMVQKQRKILLQKRIQLVWLTFLVKIRRCFK